MELQKLDLVCPACRGTGFRETFKSFSDLLSLPEYEECFCDAGVFYYVVELEEKETK